MSSASANSLACSEDAYTGTIMPLVSILQGISFSSTLAVRTTRAMVRLWLHECTRVIEGRLRDQQNIMQFRGILHRNMRKHFALHFPLHKAYKPPKEKTPANKQVSYTLRYKLPKPNLARIVY